MDSVQVQMSKSPSVFDSLLHQQLEERLDKIRRVSLERGANPELNRLLGEVDAALERFEKGTYGICEECHTPIEADRLLADPLMRVCLDDLSEKQQRALESDLQLAAQIQDGLLPKTRTSTELWEADFVYQPAGIVSGDYVDLIPHNGDLFFILGDVSGKGMAASLMMSSLHAMFHSLIPLGLPLTELMSRANHLLCESTLANQFATLVCGRADSTGEVEIVNAGHLPPIVVRKGEHLEVNSAGLPLGMFCDVKFESSKLSLGPEDTLLLYTDGVTEAASPDGSEFGVERLLETANGGTVREPASIVSGCLRAVEEFRGNTLNTDDLTIMALRFSGAADRA